MKIFRIWLCILFFNSCADQNTYKVIQENNHLVNQVTSEIYQWPKTKRIYWPTKEWRNEHFHLHEIKPGLLLLADSLAGSDNAFQSLIIVKNGFIVFENYYNEGKQYHSTEVWSVTKSITSALIGIAIDQGYIQSIDKRMVDYLPEYSEFNNITIRDVLTHTTGLNWDENNQLSWIQSDDWVSEALHRGLITSTDSIFFYSSANSHFLSKLIKATTGMSPGEFAKKNLFDPLGIRFKPSKRQEMYTEWEELHLPIPNSWRQDNNGLEIGAYGLHLSAREMAKFGFLYLNKGKWNNRTLISEKWIDVSTRAHIFRNKNKSFGLHWVISRRNGKICIEADGWGGQMISIVPSLDLIVVIKCDPINPRENESYRVLELCISAAS